MQVSDSLLSRLPFRVAISVTSVVFVFVLHGAFQLGFHYFLFYRAPLDIFSPQSSSFSHPPSLMKW